MRHTVVFRKKKMRETVEEVKAMVCYFSRHACQCTFQANSIYQTIQNAEDCCVHGRVDCAAISQKRRDDMKADVDGEWK